MSNSQQRPRQLTAEDVRLILSSPVYAYGINLQPADRVAEAVMQLNKNLADEMRSNGAAFSMDDLDRRFETLLQELEASGAYTREEDCPPIVSKEQWLEAQLKTIERLSRGERL